jgi:type I restriction enzyme S subunit
LLAQAHTTRGRLEKVPAILKRFRQSVLAAACTGRLTEEWREQHSWVTDAEGSDLPAGWRDGQLADLCESISDGDHQPPPKQEQGIPFLVIGNINSGSLDFSETRFVPEAYYESIKPIRKPRRGDVLYAVVGATIGISAPVLTNHPFCFQRHIAILKPNQNTDPAYLNLVMKTQDVRRQSWENVTGSAQPTLPLGALRSLKVTIPPLSEQNEIVRRVETLFAWADAVERRVEAAKARVEKLTQSVLAKAFRGELVPHEAELARREGRDYEPASVLLERIREQRSGRGATGRRRSRGKAAAGA